MAAPPGSKPACHAASSHACRAAAATNRRTAQRQSWLSRDRLQACKLHSKQLQRVTSKGATAHMHASCAKRGSACATLLLLLSVACSRMSGMKPAPPNRAALCCGLVSSRCDTCICMLRYPQPHPASFWPLQQKVTGPAAGCRGGQQGSAQRFLL
jgi:hypothetical protein